MLFRSYHHNQLTFGLVYAFSESFILPISHDEVVHGKGSMLGKMPGEAAEKFANLRAFYGFMWGHPGKKLLFMGQEFAQSREWNYNQSLDWHELVDPAHRGMQRWIRDLNHFYRDTAAMHRKDCEADGFEWLLADEAELSVFAWVRRGAVADKPVVVMVNMTPVARRLQVNLPEAGIWREALNSDGAIYGGSDLGNMGQVVAEVAAQTEAGFATQVDLPPLSAVFFVKE